MEFSRGTEIAETKNPESKGYREIKPESDMTVKEARGFWDKVFGNKEADETSKTVNDGENLEKGKIYYDDNGEKYREGDELEPNKKFKVNDYQYETDEYGRTISAEGTLRLRDPDFKRNVDTMEVVGKGNQKEGDHVSHLFAYRFGGSGGIENLVAMDAKLNQGDYAKLENTLASAVKEGADVKMKVEPVYEGKSNRPSEIKVSYSIDGDKEVVVFKNRREE